MYEVHKASNEEATLVIYHDEVAESPRAWSNLGTMVCFHRRYSLGDEHDFLTPDEFLDKLSHEHAIVLPLYLYDHNGIAISTTPFLCTGDSGKVGWIYVCVSNVCKEFGVEQVTPKVRREVEKILQSEVAVYDQYLRGNVYGFHLYVKCGYCSGDHKLVESCWGFYGENAAQHIADMLPKNCRELVADW